MTTGKSLRLLIPILLASFSGYAQTGQSVQHVIDSLEQVLPMEPNDTNKVTNLINLSQIYKDGLNDHDRSLSYLRMADTIAQQLKYDKGRVLILALIAFDYAGTGNWPRSFVTVDEAWPLAEKTSPEQLSFLCSIMFMNYAFRSEWNTAKTWGLKGLNETAFHDLPDQAKWPTYMQLTLAYASLDSLDVAEYYASFLKTYISKKLNAPGMLENAYRALGLLERKKRNYAQAIDYLRRDPVNATGLAILYDELKQTDLAIHYAKIGLEVATEKKIPPDVIKSSEILAKLYEKTDTALAYKYLQINSAAKDSLYNSNWREEEEKRVLGKQKEQFQKETQEANYRNRIIQISLIALAGVFLISALLFRRSNRIKQNANRKLEKAYGDLKATQAQLIQSEKMASLGELTAGIAHEIQNPLNFVNNFSEVNRELIEEMKDQLEIGNRQQAMEMADSIRENEEKINHHGRRADAIVKGMLQHSRAGSGQKEPTDINALCDEYLRLAYHAGLAGRQGLRAKDKFFNGKVETDFDRSIGKINIIPQDIGRVILNLINNAFYAVSEKQKQNIAGYEPTVTVTTRKLNDNVVIRVKDNGNGIPQNIIDKIFQPFFTTRPAGQGTGLGLSLAYDIIKSHSGTISVESLENQGTEFKIHLPYTSGQ